MTQDSNIHRINELNRDPLGRTHQALAEISFSIAHAADHAQIYAHLVALDVNLQSLVLADLTKSCFLVSVRELCGFLEDLLAKNIEVPMAVWNEIGCVINGVRELLHLSFEKPRND